MISNIITFGLTYMDVFDGLIIGILFTLGCQRMSRWLSKTKPA